MPTSSRGAAPAAVPVLDIGGSHVTAAAVDPVAVRVIPGSRQRLPLSPDADPPLFLTALAAAAAGLAGRRLHPVWGIALPGPFDYAAGVARYRGVGKFDALDGFPVGEHLTRLLPPGARPLFLNDAHAFALGAWHTSPDRPARMAAITLGTGVGSAFLDAGRIVTDSPEVPPEGRADLLTIDGDPLEERVSTRAVTARYAVLTGRVPAGWRELTSAAAAGEGAAREVVDTALSALGGALAPWLSAFKATTLVVGGSVAASWPTVGPPLTAGLTAHDEGPATVHLVPRTDGEDAALVGAAVRALREG